MHPHTLKVPEILTSYGGGSGVKSADKVSRAVCRPEKGKVRIFLTHFSGFGLLGIVLQKGPVYRRVMLMQPVCSVSIVGLKIKEKSTSVGTDSSDLL